jgi:CRP-like cAMP-binding protein
LDHTTTNGNGSFDEAIECVSCVALFQDLSQQQIHQVAGLLEVRLKSNGELLTIEGEPAHDMYILCQGEVSVGKKLRLPSLEAVDTEDRILTRIDATTLPVLGETALVGGGLRLATIRCTTDCRFYCLNAARLHGLMAADPTIGAAVYRRLCEMLYERLEWSNTDVVKLSAALVFALED